jgi:hypothetical protein
LLWLNSSLNGVASNIRTFTFATNIQLVYTLGSACALWVGGVATIVQTISPITEIGLLYTLGSACALLA